MLRYDTFGNLRRGTLLVLMFAVCGFGCELEDASPGPERPDREGETGLSVAVQGLDASTTRMRISVETCGGTPVASRVRPLEKARLPGGVEKFENKPYDAESAHQFADHYFTLDAGCYRASAVPVDKSGTPLRKCSPSHSQDLQVEDGKTTEVLLLSQCRGPDRGGLDVMGTINHPPHAQSIVYRPSKFLTCPQSVTICVDAVDPDGDPMRAEWRRAAGPVPRAGINKTVTRQSGDTLRECVRLQPGIGLTQIEYKVWDRLKHEGKWIDFDEFFRREGRSERSHDFVTFPVYSGPGQCVRPDAGSPDTTTSDTGVDTGTDTGDYDDVSEDTGRPDTGADAGGCDCPSAVSVLRYDVERNGRRTRISSLSSVQEGDEITAHFSVDSACRSVELSLVSYEASGATFQNSFPQSLHDSATGTFGPGTHSLGSVRIPACYFQTEFVCGRVLTGSELNSGQRYGVRKIDWHNGGSRACQQSQSCTRTRGYWSNHHEHATNPSQQQDWPQPHDEDDTICGRTWLETVGLKGAHGRVWRILAPQWIAAKLNVAAAGSVPLSVSNTIQQAGGLLKSNCSGIPKADRQQALSLKDVLDSYNNGDFGSQQCP